MMLQEGVPILGRRAGCSDATQVGLNGVFGHREAEFEEFASDTFSAPTRLFGRDPSNQRDEVRGELRTTSSGASLDAPEESEPLAVPPEQGLGLEDQKGLSPRAEAAGEEQQGETVGAGAAWPLKLALKDEKLLTEQGILEYKLGFGAG